MTEIEWEERTTVKKGSLGEKIVERYFNSLGKNWALYQAKVRHPTDYIIMDKDASPPKIIAYLEIKTKASRKYYPDTGFNYKNFLKYEKLEEPNTPFYIIFVDEIKGMIYGNFLYIIKKGTVVKLSNGTNKVYPSIEIDGRDGVTQIIYFPLRYMKDIYKLSPEEIKELKKLNTRNVKYD